MLGGEEVSSAQVRKLVDKLNFAQVSLMGKVGRVALRPPYDVVTRKGGKHAKRGRRARGRQEWQIKLSPVLAPRSKQPIGGAVDVRIYSDACATGGGMAAGALSPIQGTEFTVLLEGTAKALADSLMETNGIFGLEISAIVPALVAPGEQLGERE